MAIIRTQIIVVGGGMVGLAFATAMAKHGRDVVVIEKQARSGAMPDKPTLRVSALNHAVRTWLQELGAWERIPADKCGDYQGMHVWEHDSFGHIHFSANQADLADLGTIIENAVVEAALWQSAEAAGVRLLSDVTFTTPEYHEHDVSVQLSNNDVVIGQLLIAADGGQSRLRGISGTPVHHRDYEQEGVVCTIQSTEPHQGIARQVFLGDGPLALLPMADPFQCSIVWSTPKDKAQSLLALSDSAFNQALTAASDGQLGVLSVVSKRVSFPLTMRYAEDWLYGRQVLMGDAAHTIHPLAGQGANLGFGDAFVLAERLRSLGTLNGQWNQDELMRALRGYQRARKAAALRHIAVMEGFHQLFTKKHPLVRLTRAAGLALTQEINPLKDFFLNQANHF
ncbi:UbiH/UbiF/VisC/COQ6 family ubiquinone biosynthesis hydroxylase [Aliidiomarina indica]|uniref:UbiH/UbiF/VisC/COQ6 family ubiquinone biosynthesis hydroxylase n=1 Tax=Aliidiomarina indica TaxID=2749147 RepID=UPI00188EF5C1|nr:UbiH/UbiF/VisC/COQ6 family ubiquinone biosynthesis hydroxylase [Aliidiomarina indica]